MNIKRIEQFYKDNSVYDTDDESVAIYLQIGFFAALIVVMFLILLGK